MNTDDDSNTLHPWIEPELEARLTALVLGEASDFERDELERLVAERPELGLYRKRLEAMHRVLHEVAKGENGEGEGQGQGEWKLAPERRSTVLARLGGEAATGGEVVVMSGSKRRLPWGMVIRIAACVAVIAMAFGITFPASTGSFRFWRSGGEVPRNVLAYHDTSGTRREADPSRFTTALTTATSTPSTEPMVANNPGQIGALNGTVAIGAGGDIILHTDPEPAAASAPASAPVSPAPAESQKLAELQGKTIGTVTRSMASSATSDFDTIDLAGTAETPIAEKAKTQVGVALVEEERMNAPQVLAQNTGSATPVDAPAARSRKFAEKEMAAASEGLKADEKPLMEREKKASDDFGSFALNQSGPPPAPIASPKPVTAGPASGPASGPVTAGPASGPVAAGEPMLEQRLMKQGTGTLALNGGVSEFDGFLDLERKKAAAVNAPTAGATRNSTSDLRISGGTEAKGNVAMDSLSIASGGVVAGAGGKEGNGGFGNEAPAKKRDELNRSAGAGGGAAKEGEVSRFGRSSPVDKSMELGTKLEAADRTKDRVIRRELPMANNEASIESGTTNFGAGVSRIEKQEDFRKSGDGDIALPGLRQDGEKSTLFDQADKDRSPEADKSVRDILALTPQAEVGKDRELSSLYASTESEGRLRMVSVPDGAVYNETRAKLLKGVAETWETPTPAALDETSPEAEPFSTFSLHVSDVSFQLAKAALGSGKWPEAEKIRIEEFVNAFDYGDPMPAMGERVAARIDQAAHPFLQQRNLVRIALRTAEAGRSSGTPLRLTLLLDSSGSMERPDRRETVRRAVATLAGLLGENDRITLVSFARQPRLVADALAGNEAMKLAETVASLPSEGGTNLEAALQLAFEKAREHQDANAQNRIVLLTDGAANLGDAKAESLAAQVEGMREAGIAFDSAGFGAEGLNDEILEALTRKGDGRYYLLDRPEDAEETFAEQIAGALRPAAKNVKVQVEFNPDRVKSYKLLGFEKHRLATEDFRNDAVDAAEMAAAEAGVAVYQVEPNPAGQGDLGSVSVRFRDLDSGEMIERRWALPHLTAAPTADQGGDAILLATVASQFAAKLAGGPLGDVVDLGELAELAAALPEGQRVSELRTMIEQARGLEGNR